MKGVATTGRRRLPSRAAVGRLVGGWPVWLHRAGLGRLVGARYAVICSLGRRTGRLRRAAVMVGGGDPRTGEVFVVAGSREAQWYRNLSAAPAAEVWIGARRFRPTQRMLSAAEIAGVLLALRRDHPREARIQAAFFGWPWPSSVDEVTSLAATLGGVALRDPALRQ